MFIYNFTYNGFFGEVEDTLTGYKVEFKEWTRDPGVFVGVCSDGKERFVPTFAIVNSDDIKSLPKQFTDEKEKEEEMVLFGAPSES